MPASDWSRVDAVALAVLHRHHGVARIDAFLGAGLSRHQVAAVFRRGVIERPRFAWYVDPGLPWQAKRAVRVGGVLGCVSAADSWGVPVPPDPAARVHVVVPPDASHLRHHRDSHREVVAGEDERVDLHWTDTHDAPLGWRVTPVDALLHLGDCVAEGWFVAALDAALRPGATGPALLSADDLRRIGGLVPRRLRRALASVDPTGESCLESLLRLGLLRRGIGPVVAQFSPDGRRRVDFLIGSRLIVEADGAAYHDPARDAERDAHFRALGYAVLRFTYEEIVFALDSVLDRIEAALAAL